MRFLAKEMLISRWFGGRRKRSETGDNPGQEAAPGAVQAKMLVFDFSRVKREDLKQMLEQGIIDVARTRVPTKDEYTPHPKPAEVVISRDLLTTGIHFPLDPVVVSILRVWKMYLHQLTPNTFVRLQLYMWVYKTSRVTPSAEGFAYAHRVHKQSSIMKVYSSSLEC